MESDNLNSFWTIEQTVQSELVEKKSRFITNLFYVKTSQEAEEKLKEIKKKYFDAKHNCSAYRVIENNQIVEKSSDDGEPSSTAGVPMLNILQKNNYMNIMVVVTRYFGGILLGTGGLVRAYSNSLINALNKSKKVQIHKGTEYNLKLEYKDLDKFKYYCKQQGFNITKIEYGELVSVNIEITLEKNVKLQNDYNSKKFNTISLNRLENKYIKQSNID